MTQLLTQKLISRFNQEKVAYCHWKSKTFEGETDFDLLISHKSLALATEILMQLGFKAAAPRWEVNPPGVFHYYGYDILQDDFIHLHIFTKVLSGERFVKSHLFPFEEMLFENACSIDNLTVISKESHLVLFVLKTMIRYGSLLDTPRLIKGNGKLREEAQWLKKDSDMGRVEEILAKYCPIVSKDIFVRCLNAIEEDVSLFQKWQLSYQMRRRLRIYRKYSFPGWLMGHVRFLFGTLIKKIRKQKGNKISLSGGTTIAIVGADATGKSTLVSEASRWLRKSFVVTTIHTGKPQSSLLTFPINKLLAIRRRIKSRSKGTGNRDKRSLPKKSPLTDKRMGVGSVIYGVRAVTLAWDRRNLILKARQKASNGEIIVSDRYPTTFVGLMDSPRLSESPLQKGMIPFIYVLLARIEKGLYQQIPPPDVVLRLRVSLETAMERNALREISDDEDYLQERHQQAQSWYMPGTRVIHDIDTDLPLPETVMAVKQAIWESL